MKHILLTILLSASFVLSHGQSCTIQSDNTVCKDELISFSFTAGKAVSSASWDFGDNSSGNQTSVTHSYSTAGPKTVSLSLTFTDGTSCSTSRQIMVHDLPTADFDINGSEFCLNDHEVCLADKSTMGTTTNGYSNRLVIWGDGNVNASSSPQAGQDICYSSYGAWSMTPYTITVEVQNDQGCEDQWQEQVIIKQDYLPSFTFEKNKADCNSQRVCFTNDSATADTNIASYEWDFGDGTTNSTHWQFRCHDYTSPGSYPVTLTVTMKNGCTSTYERTVVIDFVDLKVEVTVEDSVLCFPNQFVFSSTELKGVRYNWELADSTGAIIDMVSRFKNPSIPVPYPGEFMIRLRTGLGDCIEHTRWVRVNALGVDPSFNPLNRHQCEVGDTVYFYNTSYEHPDARARYGWQFEDPNAPNCMGWRGNCNEDDEYHSRHYYSDTGCFFPRLFYYDSASGCTDTTSGQVTRMDIQEAWIKAELQKQCIGNKQDYRINFYTNVCVGEITAQYDSCRGWEQFQTSINYDSVCDPDGWVSATFHLVIGDSVVYRSADPNDWYIDQRRICSDTLRYTDWFQLHPEPDTAWVFEQEQCLPGELTIRYTSPDTSILTRMGVSWGGAVEAYDIVDTIPVFRRTFTGEGNVPVIVFMEDSIGCYSVYSKPIYLGYYNDFIADSIICAGDTLFLNDSVSYFNKTQDYWSDGTRPELLSWDLDTGAGFQFLGRDPAVVLRDRGTYQIRMRTTDSAGCSDTVVRTVNVVGVNAGFMSDTSFACNQIVQFLDSSYLDYKQGGDSIVSYYWDFGDGSVHSVLKDPYHYYNRNGWLDITHAVRSEANCKDTLRFSIYIDGPEPGFDIISDSIGCVPFTVELRSESHKVSTLVWHLGDSAMNTISAQGDTSFRYTYDKPGVYEIYLEGADSFYNEQSNNYYTCKSVYPDSTALQPILKRVHVLPYPPARIGTSAPICLGDEIWLWSESDSQYTAFDWEINGVGVSAQDSFSYTFDQAGTYDVRLLPTYVPSSIYERECFDTATLEVEILDVRALFGIQQLENCSKFQFIDSSLNAITYSWELGLGETSTEQNPTMDYGVTSGTHQICLQISSADGCRDTFCRELETSYVSEAYLYNVFTPGTDGLNDLYTVDITNPGDFDLQIFNRWGELVYQSTDPNEGWNGQLFNTGAELPGGTYFYILKYSFSCVDEEHESRGTVDLIR